MGLNIGDIFLRLMADGARLEADVVKEAEKAGEAGGRTLGQRLSAGLRTEGLRAFGAVASAAFGLATKGATELTDAQLEYQAQTGASAEEAERAGKSIANLARVNTEGFRELAGVLSAVRQNLGLTGDAAERAAQQALDFAKVTKQDAVAVVAQFDDILDAWNLTAADQGAIMDKLLRSQQRYGGSVSANAKALAEMAPQLSALNVGLDGGIALLNLFSASGMDASKATFALNTAVQKLKPGQTLDDLIRQIASIEDPTKRAQAAVEVFGARGGVALANVLRPGVTGLADFAISADDAAGAVEAASDAIDEQLGNRVALALKKVTVPLAEFGKELGPAVTGLVSLGTAAATVAPGLIRQLSGLVTKGLAGAWKAAAGASVVTRAVAFASSQAATLYLRALMLGDAAAGALRSGWSRLIALPGVSRAIGLAGAAAGVVYNAAASAVSALSGAVAGAWGKVAANSAVQRAAMLAGGKVGAFFAVGVATLGAALIGQALKEGFLDAAKDEGFAADSMADLGTEVWRKAGGKITDLAEEEAPRIGDTIAEGLGRGLVLAAPKVEDAMNKAVVRPLRDFLTKDEMAQLTQAAGNRAGEGLARGILDARQKPVDAFEQLKEMLKRPLSKTAEVTRLLGQLASKELQDGLTSRDPAIRAWAQHVKQSTIDRLYEIKPSAGTLSKEAAKLLEEGLKSNDPDIRAAAENIYALVRNPLHRLPTDANLWGQAFARQYAAGIRLRATLSTTAAQELANNVRNVLQVRSPAKEGPFSEMGGPEGWGKRFVTLWARGAERELGGINRALAGLNGFAPPTAAAAIGSVPATTAPGGGGGLTVNGGIHVHGVGSDVSPTAAQRFGQAVLDEVALGLREQAARLGMS